jgi:hypothetical protein
MVWNGFMAGFPPEYRCGTDIPSGGDAGFIHSAAETNPVSGGRMGRAARATDAGSYKETDFSERLFIWVSMKPPPVVTSKRNNIAAEDTTGPESDVLVPMTPRKIGNPESDSPSGPG